MKYLLTSAGIKNPSIHDALIDMLGKPISESTALIVPTAIYAMPGGLDMAYRIICGTASTPFCELGWKSLGVLELTALASIERDCWVPLLQETDALLVGGGDALYLSYWMQQSGLADLLPSLAETVYVGVSGGSMVLAPNVGEEFIGWKPPSGEDKALGVVGFSIFPHLDHERFPDNSMAGAVQWAAKLPGQAYAIDDQTAIRVVDGDVDVISEGHWRSFNT